MASWTPDEPRPPRQYGVLLHAAVMLAGLAELLRRWRRPGGRWVL